MKHLSLPTAVMAGVCIAISAVATPATATPASPTQTTATKTMTVKKTLYPGDRTITAGETATYSGAVTAGPRGTKASFQLYSGGKWVTLASSTVGSTGKFTVRAKPTSPGVRKVRLTIGGNSTYKTYYSYPNTLTVSRWRYLTDMQPVASSGDTFDEGVVAISGTPFARSLWTEQRTIPDSMEYNLGRTCTRFMATAGQDDESRSTTSTDLLEVTADSAPLWSSVVGFGRQYPVSVDVTGYLRLKLANSTVKDTGRRYVAWGSPRILCAS